MNPAGMHTKKYKNKYWAIIIIVTIILLLMFTPLNISQYQLTTAQRQNFCNALIDVSPEDWGDGEFKNSAVVASADIFGISGLGKKKTVYGYLNEGLYVEANGKSYEISGGLYEFMVDIEIDGDSVSIIKEYGDGVSTMSTLQEMPIRYRCKWYVYVSMGFDQLLLNRTRDKVEDELGVPADMINTLNINEDENTYEIYDIDSEGNITVKYKGKASNL